MRCGEADAFDVHRRQEEGDQLLLVLADAEIAGRLDPGDGVAAGIGERDQVGTRALRRQELRGEIDRREGVPDRADIAAALGGDQRLGVGFELQTAFQMFDVALVLAYALAFTAVVQAIEIGIMQPWERWAGGWRR